MRSVPAKARISSNSKPDPREGRHEARRANSRIALPPGAKESSEAECERGEQRTRAIRAQKAAGHCNRTEQPESTWHADGLVSKLLEVAVHFFACDNTWIFLGLARVKFAVGLVPVKDASREWAD